MKKFILLLTFCTFLSTATAQDPISGSTTVKEVLVIDYFNHPMELPVIYSEMLRSEVRKGFIQRGRHNVADATQIPGMRITAEMVFTPHDPGQFELSRIAACQEFGAYWLVWGDITAYDAQTLVVSGKRQYKNSLTLLLSGMNLHTGEVLTPEEFKLSATASEDADAKKRMIAQMLPKMELYIDRYFKISGSVLHVEAANNKGKYKELFIDCGGNLGVHPGDLFLVYRTEDTGGMALPHKIGKIRVKEVTGANMSRCVIASGGSEIAEEFDNGRTVTVVSSGESFF